MGKKQMTKPHISAQLRIFLKKHSDELEYATRDFTPQDVIAFNVSVNDDYEGKGKYSFNGNIEIKDPRKDGITSWLPIKGNIYIEEGEDNEPKFSNIETIFLYF